MPAPDLTAIVVTYRSAAHVGAALEALASAAGRLEVELVVVDNASGDGTPDLVRRQAPDARLILNESNRGFAAAVNQAARAAAGRHLLLLNPDARPLPGCISRLVAELDALPEAALAGPQLIGPDGAPQPSAWRAPGLLSLAYDALLLHNLMPRSRLRRVSPTGREPVDVECVSGACLLVRRTAFEALGGLDERFFIYFEDTDLAVRARAAGYRVRLVPAAQAVHLVGGSSFQDRREFLVRFHQSRRRYLAKHHRGPKGAALRILHGAGFAVRATVDRLRGLV
ncbi:MAG TPA: glycosyltransferase family 2 protein [Vicinamibacteria bacterium]|jgi:GT2 family glycosyltransferase